MDFWDHHLKNLEFSRKIKIWYSNNVMIQVKTLSSLLHWYFLSYYSRLGLIIFFMRFPALNLKNLPKSFFTKSLFFYYFEHSFGLLISRLDHKKKRFTFPYVHYFRLDHKWKRNDMEEVRISLCAHLVSEIHKDIWRWIVM